MLGQGGFGTVYAAIHPLIGKRAAIKVLARKYSADPGVVSRFVAEARAVNQIRHRNIIDIFAFGQLADGRHYYVMEYLDGTPLDAYLKERGPLPLDQALPILRAIARALDAAHSKGIAHRDLKPENIFIAQDSDGGLFPKLLDFGIAKLMTPEDDVLHRTGTGVPLGTPYYMSPEQCRGRDIDHRTDVYSLGIVAYRVLTGTFPFEGDNYVDLLFKQVNEEPPPPSSRNSQLPASVDRAIAWMMQKDREKRPPTVNEAVSALDPNASLTLSTPPAVQRGSKPSVSTPDALAATSTPDSLPVVLETKKPRSRLPIILGVLVLTAGGVAAFVLTREEAKPAPTRSESVAPVAAIPIDAPMSVAPDALARPSHVAIKFTGVPDGTEIRVAGNLFGVTPEHAQLLYDKTERVVTLQADGYVPTSVKVVPDHDQEISVKLKMRAARTMPTQPKSKDDVEAPDFGK